MPHQYQALVTPTNEPILTVPATTEPITQAALIDMMVALANRVEFLRVRVPEATGQPERFCVLREDFLEAQYLSAALSLAGDTNWTGIGIGSPSVNGIAGSPKNPGQLRVTYGNIPATDQQFYFYKGQSATGKPFSFANVDQVDMTVSVDDDPSNLVPLLSCGLTSNASFANGGTDCLMVVYSKGLDAANWLLFKRVSSVQTTSVLAAKVDGEFLVVRFVRNAALGLDVLVNESLVTTVAAAALPLGNCAFAGNTMFSQFDPNPFTGTFDFMGIRSSTGARQGA